MTERRELGRRQRREAILDAAARVFGDRGASEATMEEVAEAAEVSKGTVYLYFRSKDDLFVALTHRPLDAVIDRFDRLVALPLRGTELVAQLLDAHGEVLRDHATHLRIGIASLCGGGFEPDPTTPSLADYRERVRRVRETYVAAIERGVADGSIRRDVAPEETAAALWAAMFGANLVRVNAERFRARLAGGSGGVDVDRMVPALGAILVRGISAEAER